jgi:hypothetical protein
VSAGQLAAIATVAARIITSGTETVGARPDGNGGNGRLADCVADTGDAPLASMGGGTTNAMRRSPGHCAVTSVAETRFVPDCACRYRQGLRFRSAGEKSDMSGGCEESATNVSDGCY